MVILRITTLSYNTEGNNQRINQYLSPKIVHFASNDLSNLTIKIQLVVF